MINLQLLGGLDVVGPDLSPDARARRRHPLMLLAVVASAAPQPVSRERLMAFLWPESDTARASNSLRQALHSLRRDLGEHLFLPENPCGIQLDPSKLAVDLWTFRDSIEKKTLADAVAAYRGPFLDGFLVSKAPEFAAWVEGERATIERQFIASLDQLGREAEDAGRFEDAVTWRRRQAESDPFSSRAALGLLKALSAAGDRPGALAYANVYENFLRAHLEVEPDPAIAEFVATLRRPSPSRMVAIQDAPNEVAEVSRPLALRPTMSMLAIPAPPMLAQRPTRAKRWLVSLGIIGVGLVGAGSTLSMVAHPAPDPIVVLGSGGAAVGSRDTADMLVACNGPACPKGTLPQPAFVIPHHMAYTDPAPATQYIAPVPDAATIKDPGYKCCTTAVFERTFNLPTDATSATVTITLAADNQAVVAMNGTEFGRQPDKLLQWNFAGSTWSFSTSFVPDPSGVNRLRVTLWDGGGVTGLYYRAMVRYDRSAQTK
jgi:DNA-binding SARP family transcriptional activator